MAAGSRALRIEDVRKAIATSVRALADDVTDGFTLAHCEVRHQLNELADRYEAGTNTDADAATLLRLHSWVINMTAPSRKEERDA